MSAQLPFLKRAWNRVSDVALNKAIEIGLGVLFTLAAVWFGIPHARDLFDGSDSPQQVAQAESGESSELTQAARTEVPEVSQVGEIADGNVGFRRTEPWHHVGSIFTRLEPGDQEPPFTEVKSGVQTLDFSTLLESSEGGFLKIGDTVTNWQVTGTMALVFEQSSLYKLLEDGEENFLIESLQPLLVDAGERALKKTDLPALREELKGTDTTEELKAEAEEKQETEVEKLSRLIAEEAEALLSDDYSVHVEHVEVEEVHILSTADLSRPHLNDLTSASMFRTVEKPLSNLQEFRTGTAGGVASIVFLVLAIGVMCLFASQFH